MKAVIQSVKKCLLTINGSEYSRIESGMLALVGIKKNDTEKEAALLAQKLLTLRIFEDTDGKMNLNLFDAGFDIMAVSNFTVCGNCTKSRRPDFFDAMPFSDAKKLFDFFINQLQIKAKEISEKENKKCVDIKTGVFGSDMKITFTNDGPVTLIVDTEQI